MADRGKLPIKSEEFDEIMSKMMNISITSTSAAGSSTSGTIAREDILNFPLPAEFLSYALAERDKYPEAVVKIIYGFYHYQIKLQASHFQHDEGPPIMNELAIPTSFLATDIARNIISNLEQRQVGFKYKTFAFPIPVIDLHGRRSDLIDDIRSAAQTWGCFQVVNHKVNGLFGTMSDLGALFHSVTIQNMGNRDGVSFTRFNSPYEPLAIARHTLHYNLAPNPPHPDSIPLILHRNAVATWNNQISKLGEYLMEMLSEGLGLGAEELQAHISKRDVYAKNFPYSLGSLNIISIPYTFSSVITLLYNGDSSGYQIRHNGEWIEVLTLDRAIIVCIGDFLQILSNDTYRSVPHRIIVDHVYFYYPLDLSEEQLIARCEYNDAERPMHKARTCFLVFFNPIAGGRAVPYGPMLANQKALYRKFLLEEYERAIQHRRAGQSMVGIFRKRRNR